MSNACAWWRAATIIISAGWLDDARHRRRECGFASARDDIDGFLSARMRWFSETSLIYSRSSANRVRSSLREKPDHSSTRHDGQPARQRSRCQNVMRRVPASGRGARRPAASPLAIVFDVLVLPVVSAPGATTFDNVGREHRQPAAWLAGLFSQRGLCVGRRTLPLGRARRSCPQATSAHARPEHDSSRK